MEQYKQEFIEFMVESQVLKFGEFTLKSGRKSPFFMNAGAYVTGSQLKRLCFSSPDTGFRIKNVTSSPTCRGGGFPNLGRFGSRSITPMC